MEPQLAVHRPPRELLEAEQRGVDHLADAAVAARADVEPVAEVEVHPADDVFPLVEIGIERERRLPLGLPVHDRDLQGEGSPVLLPGRVRAGPGVELAGRQVRLAPAPLDEGAIGVRLEHLGAEGDLEDAGRELRRDVVAEVGDTLGFDLPRDRPRAAHGAPGRRGIHLEDEAGPFARHELELQARAAQPEKRPVRGRAVRLGDDVVRAHARGSSAPLVRLGEAALL